MAGVNDNLPLTMKRHGASIHSVGSYQVSGVPWISGSDTQAAGAEVKYSFPYVAKSVTIVNLSTTTVRLHFNSNDDPGVASGLHYMELDSDEDSYTFNARCKEIYVSAPSDGAGVRKYRVVAELTGIPTGSMFILTGSGLTTTDGT